MLGHDNIPIEMRKCSRQEGVDMLWNLMKKIYMEKEMPAERRDSRLYLYTRRRVTSRTVVITGV